MAIMYINTIFAIKKIQFLQWKVVYYFTSNEKDIKQKMKKCILDTFSQDQGHLQYLSDKINKYQS